MSIELVGSSLLLNSYSFTHPPFGGCGMFMDTTWNCPKSTTVHDVVRWTLLAHAQTPDKYLHHVVLNFHGSGTEAAPGQSAKIFVGEASPESGMNTNHYVAARYYTIDLGNVGAFTALKGKKIGSIWVKSCGVATDLKGKYLCQRIAECSGCRVVAAEEDQEEWFGILNLIFMPRGCIDDFEGPVTLWDGKSGKVGPFHPNGRAWT